jgi:hypothetical protein
MLEHYKVAKRYDTISETWDWRVYLDSGAIISGATISRELAEQKIAQFQ